MNKEKEYAKNTIILLIGKFSTQFMSLLLLPLYTYFLQTEDYGLVDFIQTYITLFVPILTLKLDSAAFRYLIDVRDDEGQKKTIITNIITVLILALCIFSVVYIVLINFIDLVYSYWIYINVLILMISNVLLQILRGLGKNKEYTISAIISAISVLAISCVSIIGLKVGAQSILISSTIANIFVIIYIFIKTNLTKYISYQCIDKVNIKDLLKYSIPMIPNQLSWWIVNVSDRTIITYFLGASFNGIYAVSCKFSNIINTIFGIFSASWQETASLYINDKESYIFFSNMINKIFKLFSTMSLVMIATIPFVFNIIIGKNYSDAFEYIPILMYGNMFNILIGLIGGIYVALKKIKQIANTTIISAIINIVFNLFFIKKLNLYAAAISTFIAYFILSIYRYKDVQKYVKIRIDKKMFIVVNIMFVIANIVYKINNIYIYLSYFIVCLIYFIVLNKEYVNVVFNSINRVNTNKNI